MASITLKELEVKYEGRSYDVFEFYLKRYMERLDESSEIEVFVKEEKADIGTVEDLMKPYGLDPVTTCHIKYKRGGIESVGHDILMYIPVGDDEVELETTVYFDRISTRDEMKMYTLDCVLGIRQEEGDEEPILLVVTTAGEEGRYRIGYIELPVAYKDAYEMNLMQEYADRP